MVDVRHPKVKKYGENKLIFNEMMMRFFYYYTNMLSWIFIELSH